MKPTARISKSEFLSFRVKDREDMRQLGEYTYEALIETGIMTLNDLLDNTFFIKADIIENLNDIPSELIDDGEIDDPINKLNVEWV
jgi:hypothetical protein